MRFCTLLTKVQQSAPECEIVRCSTELVRKVQRPLTMIIDWQKLPKFVVLIGSFEFDWVLLILILKSISAFDADCLCFLLALPFSH